MPADEPAEELRHRVESWLEVDPDPETRAELERLVANGDGEALAERFSGRLVFGTAGIRGIQRGGPNGMNRVTVRRMVAGIASFLGPQNHVVIGYDARHNSEAFARDAADVLAANGIEASLLSGQVPTPVLSFAVPHLGADLGLMVTASHNPPADNGCKVFLRDGAQLVSPIDTEIEAAIDSVEIPARTLPPLAEGGAVNVLDRQVVIAEYVSAIVAEVPLAPPVEAPVAYTPLHGVGRDVLMILFDAAGAGQPSVVDTQGDPDPEFPTVVFPNPEEAGVMDAVVALARSEDCVLAVANDPDADRLAVAIPVRGHDGSSAWRTLTGDELGALLCDRRLETTDGPARKVVSTVVCSSLVEKMARAAGVHHRVTLTGFKWIIGEAYADADLEPVFAYEESLGYATCHAVRDKDGLSAALRIVELAEHLRRLGTNVAEHLDELAVRHGLHVTKHASVRFEGPSAVEDASSAVDALRLRAPHVLASRAVVGRVDYAEGGELPPTNLLRIDLEGGIRVLIRPSGTEPKTKLYLEKVVDVADVSEVPLARHQALEELSALVPQLESALLG
ncbi:MAG: phospho-sugar mutase [Acidimicrobiales bacterium]